MSFFDKMIEVAKSMGVKDFAFYKKWALDHLKKQLKEEDTVTKALEYCEEYMEKAYGVGTIRTWKGKKYIKGPDKKWRRYFDKHDRGANQAIKNIMREINSLENGDVEGLYAIIQKNAGRFRDENGNVLPEVQQIHDLVEKKQSGSEKQNSDIEKYKKLQDELKQEIAEGKRNNTKELQEDVNEWKNLLSIAEKRPGSYSKEQTEHFREIIKIGEAELSKRKKGKAKKEEKKDPIKELSPLQKYENSIRDEKYEQARKDAEMRNQNQKKDGISDEDAKELQINVDGVKNAIKGKSETEVKKYFNWAEKQFADKPEDSIERRAIAQAKKEYFGYDTNIAKGLESVADTSKVNKNIKDTTVESFVSKNDSGSRYFLKGVYHDPEGYKVATDGHFLYAEKSDISEENSDKVIDKTGTELPGKYPNWRRVIPENAPKTEIFNNRKQLIQLCLVGNKISKLNGKAPCFIKVGEFFFNTDYLNRVLSIAEKQGLNDVSITDNGQVVFKGEKGVATTLPMINFNAGTNSYLDAKDRVYYGDQSDAVKEFLGTKENVENPSETEEPKREITEEKESPEVAAKNKEFEKYGYRIKKMPDGTWAAGYKKEDGSWLDGGLRLNAPTMEEAASYIQSEINRKEESEKQEEKEKAAKEKTENQKREVEAGYGSFFSGKDAKTKAREINHLEKRVNFGNGKIQSYKEYIEEQFKNGDLEIGTHEENKLKGPSRRAYNRMDGRQQEEYERRIQAAGKKTVYEIKSKSKGGYYDLGKIAYDYAKYLIDNNGGIKKSFSDQIEEIMKKSNPEKDEKKKHDLEYYKKWALSVLSKQTDDPESEPQEDGPNEENIVKALAYVEMITKAGYPVGTIREWKGKKYIKIAPNQWKPKYDNMNRGAKMSLTNLKKAVGKCNSEEELYNLINSNASRFRDENGRPLPEVQELHDIVTKRQGELNTQGNNSESPESGSPENNGSPNTKESDRSVNKEDQKEGYAKKIEAIQKLSNQLVKETDKLAQGNAEGVALDAGDSAVNSVKTAAKNEETFESLTEKYNATKDPDERESILNKIMSLEKEKNNTIKDMKEQRKEDLTKKYSETTDPDEREKILNEMMNLDRQDEEKILPVMFDKEDEGFDAWDKDQKAKYGDKSVEELQNLLDTKYKNVKKYTPEYSEAMKIGDMIQQKKRQKK